MAARGFIELLRLAERGRQRARAGRDGAAGRWSGVAFVLNGAYYVAPLGEIAEVLKVPEYTTVPGVQQWLKGLANVRGRLLPLTDLSLFIGIDQRRPDARRKILVVDQNDLFSGLMVDEVLGIQHFSKLGYYQTQREVPAGIQPYVQGHFEREGQVWHVFLPSLLAADSRYLNAAAK
jgi:twitching motility protein PilI